MNRKIKIRIRGALAHLAKAKILLEEVMHDERDVYDDMPDSLQMSESGERMAEYIECLSAAVDDIGDVVDVLERTIEGV